MRGRLMCTDRAIAWGGAPVPSLPAGRPEITPVMGEMGRMNAPDIHEERLETLRKQAVERFRARRAYRCPDRGYRSFQRDCARYGEACEAASRPPS